MALYRTAVALKRRVRHQEHGTIESLCVDWYLAYLVGERRVYGSMPCGLSMVIPQHTSLPTVAVLLCATSSMLESLLACLLAVLVLPYPS